MVINSLCLMEYCRTNPVIMRHFNINHPNMYYLGIYLNEKKIKIHTHTHLITIYKYKNI